MIECQNCGRFIIPNDGYCEKCGQEISQKDIEIYEQRKSEQAKTQGFNEKETNQSDSLLDEKSKRIIDFFNVFNIIFAIINFLSILLVFFTGSLLLSLPVRLLVFVAGLGYTVLIYMSIEMLTKHFSNVSKIKEINYRNFMKDDQNKEF